MTSDLDLTIERPVADEGPSSEMQLWRQVGFGLIWGFLVAGLLGFVLIRAMQPDVGMAASLGLAAFIGFWSGPFIGLSGAVGYHELQRHRAARVSAGTGDTGARPTNGSASEYLNAA